MRERGVSPLESPLDEIAIELTTHCNLKCAMCSVWEGKQDGPGTELVRELLADARRLGAEAFVPCGGECFARGDFVDILEHAHLLGYQRSEVVTNGLLLPRHLDRLQALPSVHLHVSIDGPPAVHDALRGPGVHDRAVAAVRDSLARGVSAGISAVIMKPTLDAMRYIVDLACELGVREVSFQPYQQEIDGMHRDPSRWAFAPGDRSRVVDAIAALREHARSRGIAIYTESVLDLVPAYLFDGVRPIPAGGCFLPSRFLLVDVAGDVYPCFFMRDQVIGNVVRGARLPDLWHSEMHASLQMMAITSRCPGCLAACSDIASFQDRA